MPDDTPNPADLSAPEWEAYLRRRQAEREAELPEWARNLGSPPSPNVPF